MYLQRIMNDNSIKMATSNAQASKAAQANASQANASQASAAQNAIDLDKYIEEPHIIIDSCFRGRHLKRLVEHQIESYNDFIQFQVPRTISMFNPVHICSEHDLDKAVNKYRL